MSAAEVSIHEFSDEWSKGAAVIDVREPDEYHAVHVPGASSMPLQTVPERHGEIPRDRPVYLVCAVGGRSMQAAHYLAQLGVDAINVDGGTQAWVRAGLPTAAGSAPGEVPSAD